MKLSSNQSAFIMQLSSFDSSHTSDVVGTPEVLIPHDAIYFFPPIGFNGRKYPDVYFNVTVHTPTEKYNQSFRFWYYEMRATGTKIDEYRLRMSNDVVNLMSRSGGSLLLIIKTTTNNGVSYDVYIINPSDPEFTSIYSLCDRIIYDKEWGIV